MKKLSCHCGAIEAEVKMPLGGIEKIMRCNCSICKKKVTLLEYLDLMILNLQKEKISYHFINFILILLNITFVLSVEFILITDLEVIQKYMV